MAGVNWAAAGEAGTTCVKLSSPILVCRNSNPEPPMVKIAIRLAAFAILCNFAVAIWKVHLHDPYISMGGKAMEPAAIYAAIAAAFLFAGAGRFSVDSLLFCRGKKEETPPEDEPVEKF